MFASHFVLSQRTLTYWPRALGWAILLSLLAFGPAFAAPAAAPAIAHTAAPTPAPILAFSLLTPRTGWVLLPQGLYQTLDGGATWQAHTPPGFEQAALATATFVAPQTGWVVWATPHPSGQLTYSLAHTTDAGVNWVTQTLPLFAPTDAAAQAGALYLQFLPDTQTGWLVVKQATSNNFSFGALFRTTDGGATWARLALPIGNPVDFEDAANGWVTGGADGQAQYRTTDGGATWQPSLRPQRHSVFQGQTPTGLTQLQALSAQVAWAQTSLGQCTNTGCASHAQLQATQDGGQTWQPLTLPTPPTVSAGPLMTGSVPETLAPPQIPTAIGGRSQRYYGQAFDACNIPDLNTMQAWITASPYKVVNLYIGGSSRGCSNPLLTASYISQLSWLGWKFIPTWVGPQAPCTSYPSRMSSDPAIAYTEGVTEANSAIAAAVNLGLPLSDQSGTVIYYDIEAYSSNVTTACRDAVKSFISGWSGQMRARGNHAGVYGSTCGSYLSDYAGITNPPDVVWMAVWLVPPQYRPNVSVWNLACLSNSLWISAQRMRQYAGDHYETWGGFTVNIDSNMLDALVASPVPDTLTAGPATQHTSLATEWWFPWYDASGNKSAWLMVSNPGPGVANVNLALGPNRSVFATTSIAAGGLWQKNFTGVITGPVYIYSTNGQPIIASQWVWQGANFTPTLPAASAPPFAVAPPLYAAAPSGRNLGATWWLPFYDSHGADHHALVVGNPNATSAAVDVYVGGTALFTTPVSIAARGAVTLEVDGLLGGPVQVTSQNAQPIWVSERFFSAGARDVSMVVGTSATDLAIDWWYPYYDSGGLNKDVLWVGNPHATPVPIEVTFGALGITYATIPAYSAWSMDLDGAQVGPLRVFSANGLPVYTSRRVAWGGGGDFQEFKGVAGWNLAVDWWLPRYDTLSRARDEILLGNPNPLAASVAISLANQPLPGSPFTVAPDGALAVEVGELRDGPLHLTNLTGQAIIVGQRSWWDGSTNYTEQMGLPDYTRNLVYRWYVPMSQR